MLSKDKSNCWNKWFKAFESTIGPAEVAAPAYNHLEVKLKDVSRGFAECPAPSDILPLDFRTETAQASELGKMTLNNNCLINEAVEKMLEWNATLRDGCCKPLEALVGDTARKCSDYLCAPGADHPPRHAMLARKRAFELLGDEPCLQKVSDALCRMESTDCTEKALALAREFSPASQDLTGLTSLSPLLAAGPESSDACATALQNIIPQLLQWLTQGHELNATSFSVFATFIAEVEGGDDSNTLLNLCKLCAKLLSSEAAMRGEGDALQATAETAETFNLLQDLCLSLLRDGL